jgi:hypothetical protein
MNYYPIISLLFSPLNTGDESTIAFPEDTKSRTSARLFVF